MSENLTAWEEMFRYPNIPSKCYLRVILKDGTSIVGIYGSKSFARKDGIFMEKRYSLNDKNYTKDNEGIFVFTREISYITVVDYN